MRLQIDRKPVKVYPDPKRVIARFFFNGEERAQIIIKLVLKLSKEEVFAQISPLLQEYSKRHRNITKILARHCKRLKYVMEGMGVDYDGLDKYQRLLIGS